MKIIHTSDWHLGQFFQKTKKRSTEHALFIDWLLDLIVRENVKLVLVTGDIFDTSSPPSYSKKQYAQFIANLNAIDCQLVVISGNHDSAAVLDEYDPLLACMKVTVLSKMYLDDLSKHVSVIKSSSGSPQVIICAIPYIRTQEVAAGDFGESLSDKKISLQSIISNIYQDIYKIALQRQAELPEVVPIIMTGHFTVADMQHSDSERDLYIGFINAFPVSLFPPADYIALGHLHRPQTVAAYQHICYAGSPIPLSFNEIKHQKKVFMLEVTASKKITSTAINIPVFQPMHLITATDFTDFIDQLEQYNFDLTKPKVWLCVKIQVNSIHKHFLNKKIHEATQDMHCDVIQVIVMDKQTNVIKKTITSVDLQQLEPLVIFEKILIDSAMTDPKADFSVTRLKSKFKEIQQELVSETIED